MDKSTDKLRDHVCDKGGGPKIQKSEIFADVIDGIPLRKQCGVSEQTRTRSEGRKQMSADSEGGRGGRRVSSEWAYNPRNE